MGPARASGAGGQRRRKTLSKGVLRSGAYERSLDRHGRTGSARRDISSSDVQYSSGRSSSSSPAPGRFRVHLILIDVLLLRLVPLVKTEGRSFPDWAP